MVNNLVSKLDNVVHTALIKCGYTGEKSETLVVGVSGGPDSTALLYSLYRLKDQHSLELHVAHLNHDFRGVEADIDAAFVAEMASNLDLPYTIEKKDPIAYQQERGISSFEQGARELRYAFLANVANKIDARFVAVAHTADDLAETVLLHILRGTGLHGLTGMAYSAPWPWPINIHKPRLLRPLLEATKEETTAYCEGLGRDFRIDSGNSLLRFTRNKIRNELMPELARNYNPQIRDSLIRLSHISTLELDFLNKETDKIWEKALISTDSSNYPSVILDRAIFSAQHTALQSLMVRRAYVLATGDSRRLRESHIAAMCESANGGTTGLTIQLPGDWLFVINYNHLTLAQEEIDDYPYPTFSGSHCIDIPDNRELKKVTLIPGWEISVEIPNHEPIYDLRTTDPLTAYLDIKSIATNLHVRTRNPQDIFQPIGMQTTKKLQDFYTDSKIPAIWRSKIPLLISDKGIIWIVGYRISELGRVNDPDQSYLVTFKPTGK